MSRLRPALLAPLACLALAAAAAGCGDSGEFDEEPAASPPAGTSSESGEGVAAEGPAAKADAGVLGHTLPLLDGTERDLGAYRGKVVLVVNTASECGYAPQFGGLEGLYRERRGDGLVILGFPADDVVGQEPRSDEEIAEFCRANFGVTFPMFSRSNVVVDPVNPLFADLAAELGEPTYNFNKYLIDRRGRPVERFDQNTEPDDAELIQAIDALL